MGTEAGRKPSSARKKLMNQEDSEEVHCTVEGQHSAGVHPNTMHISLKLYFLHLVIEKETKTNIVKNVQEETDQTIPLYSWLAVFFPHFEARWPKTDIT